MNWSDIPIRLEPARCLAVRSSHSTCRRCVESCPAQAVRLDGQGLRLDEEACLGCGLCLAVCPADVFALDDPWASSLVARAVEQAHEGHLDASCAYAAAPADLELPCLGLLNDDLLLTLAARGVTALTFHAADCSTCPIGAGSLIAAQVDRAQARWSGVLNVQWERTPTRESADPRSALSALTSPLQSSLDRRGFFKLLGAQAGRAVSERLAPLLSEQSSAADVQLPAARQALLQAVNGQQVAFPRYTITQACDDCQDAESLCARFCPTGALRREPIEGGVQFLFHPVLCTDCNQCVDLCPQSAVQREGVGPGHVPVVLHSFQTVRCQRCGRETAVAVDGLCPACQRQSHLQQTLAQWLRPAEATPDPDEPAGVHFTLGENSP